MNIPGLIRQLDPWSTQGLNYALFTFWSKTVIYWQTNRHTPSRSLSFRYLDNVLPWSSLYGFPASFLKRAVHRVVNSLMLMEPSLEESIKAIAGNHPEKVTKLWTSLLQPSPSTRHWTTIQCFVVELVVFKSICFSSSLFLIFWCDVQFFKS